MDDSDVVASPGPRAPVTLEITVSPVDWRHAEHVLPHQMRQWAGQVDDVQFTLNAQASRGRYGAADLRQRGSLEALLADLTAEHPHARTLPVDYSDRAVAAVSEGFYGGRPVPPRNHDGGPFYSYLFGWHAARHDLVLHMDSDMLFGGGSQAWVDEALEVLRTEPEVLCCSPLPGPPTPDGLLPERIERQHAAAGSPPRLEQRPWPAYRLSGCSTRLWLFDRRRLVDALGPLPLERPRLRSHLRARLEGHPAYELPEVTLSRLMQRNGFSRLDLLGSGPGMWSLHPTMRSEHFYQQLPALIGRIERGDVPEAQRGDYDLNDSMIDWTSGRGALRRNTWWRRLSRRALLSVRG